MKFLDLLGKKSDYKKNDGDLTSFTPQENEGLSITSYGGIYSNYINVENLGTSGSDENVLINKYREMSLSQEFELAIDDIINEIISFDDDDLPIKLKIDSEEISEKTKEKIIKEFNELLRVLNFKYNGYEILKRWYVDGRLYYDKIIDKKRPKDGIKELRYIDPRKIRKVTENTAIPKDGMLVYDAPKEYFIYSDSFITSKSSNSVAVTANVNTQKESMLRLDKNRICYVNSGLFDPTTGIVLSHLHKAIRPFNILKMMEDSTVINKFVRAPQRRIFYVDVGNLPKGKSEQYMMETMRRHRNKLTYNPDTGEFNSQHKYMALTEDYWMPRRGGQSGTEIKNLEGDDSFENMDSVEYFRKKLTESLNIPLSRLEATTNFNIGRSSEINRDELKFYKFIKRLRNKFSEFFIDLLKVQLDLKKIVPSEDFDEIKYYISFDYSTDNYFSELKDEEVLKERIYTLQNIDSYKGQYFSEDFIFRNILKLNDAEILKMKEQIKKEKSEQREQEKEDSIYQIELEHTKQQHAESLMGTSSESQEAENSDTENNDSEETSEENFDLSGKDLKFELPKEKNNINKNEEDSI